ncbi:sensor domain-containing protein [Micromonospora sp. WMMD1102]|uniref:sensor histidine kinase n=1 Tax=Micromonospora sp. WMMD1102 TaxID=3016105 RepID=UPI002414EDD1|nr:sensor domain-containing protein [Micromonospora sp. WMMD1102]MDG4784789.1 sensor domain-containing protein [Micromonospora sp. WMMD1102]
MASRALRTSGLALLHGAALAGLGLAGAVLLLVHLVFFVPGFGLGLIFLVPLPILAGRYLTNLVRRLAGAGGAPIGSPYRPRPEPPRPEESGRYPHDNRLYRRPWVPAFLRWLDWVLGDPASYRDLGWMIATPVVGTLLGGLPVALLAAGAWYALGNAGRHWWALPAGLAVAAAGLAVAPCLLATHRRWTHWWLGSEQRQPGRLRIWYARQLLLLLRLAALLGLSLAALPMAAASVLGLVLAYGLGVVVVLPPMMQNQRCLPELRRKLAARWSGVEVATPYRPRPGVPQPRPDGRYQVGNNLYRTARWAAYHERLRSLVRDPGNWRDLGFLLLDPVAGGLALAAPLAAVGYGIFGLALPRLWMAVGLVPDEGGDWYASVAGSDAAAIPVGLALVALGLLAGPAVLRSNGRWVALLLAPTAGARLALRVQRLTETRADATESQAAELRRIERDLHDGAQARLVAMGINLGNIEYLMDRDPQAARALLAEARQASAKALDELRDLVRGIHPPVLAERGLGDAVRALALDIPVRTKVTVALPGRLEQPIESAAYFAVSELLTNAVKHARADRITVHLGYVDGRLRIVVVDDGRGGADETRGSGLRGIARRLGTFDGVVDLSSPPGGPTTVTLEVPCALSSPRTSIS